MGQKKKLVLLTSGEILDNLNRLIGEDQLTIQQLCDWLAEKHGIEIARSTMGRHVQDIRDELKVLNETREITKAFVAELGEDASSDTNRLLIEMLQAVAIRIVRDDMNQGEPEEGKPLAKRLGAQDLMFLGRTLRDTMQAGQQSLDLRDRIRKEVAAEMKDGVAKVAREAGITADVQSKLLQAMGVSAEEA